MARRLDYIGRWLLSLHDRRWMPRETGGCWPWEEGGQARQAALGLLTELSDAFPFSFCVRHNLVKPSSLCELVRLPNSGTHVLTNQFHLLR